MKHSKYQAAKRLELEIAETEKLIALLILNADKNFALITDDVYLSDKKPEIAIESHNLKNMIEGLEKGLTEKKRKFNALID